MSTRGSPLGSFAATRVVVPNSAAPKSRVAEKTVAATTAAATAAAEAAAIALTLETSGGSTVELRDATTAATLSAAEKAEAAAKIASLQDQLNSLMAALQ